MQAGHLKPGHSMLEVIERLANEPAAMKCVRFACSRGRPCRSRRRNCLRRFSPTRDLGRRGELQGAPGGDAGKKMGSSDRSSLSKDELMRSFF